MILTNWAIRHKISPLALAELRAELSAVGESSGAFDGGSEAAAQNRVRILASQAGCRLWRNNLGAGRLENGSFVRWGLANDTAAMNESVKSADLIGIRPVLITPSHVGTVIGQFLSREIKAPGWTYRATQREKAQLRWAEAITALGGDARFTTGEFK
jgi:hypothetical protein